MRPFGEGALLRMPISKSELEPLKLFGITSWGQALLKWILMIRDVTSRFRRPILPSISSTTPQPVSRVVAMSANILQGWLGIRRE